MSPLLGFKTKAGPHKGGFRRVHRHTPFTGGVYQPSASSAFNSLLIKTHRICSVWASMSVCLCRCVYMLYVIALCVCVCGYHSQKRLQFFSHTGIMKASSQLLPPELLFTGAWVGVFVCAKPVFVCVGYESMFSLQFSWTSGLVTVTTLRDKRLGVIESVSRFLTADLF